MNTRHLRRSIRLKDYDYTQNGAYFVTICAHDRRCIFGQVVGEVMIVNLWGEIVQSCWDEIPAHFSTVELDAFVVMPNHLHGVIVIGHDRRDMKGMTCHAPTTREFSKPVAGSLYTIIGAFKSAVTRRINQLPDRPDHPVWQRNFYEHIIRDDGSLHTIRAYVANNPAKWAEDTLYVGS